MSRSKYKKLSELVKAKIRASAALTNAGALAGTNNKTEEFENLPDRINAILRQMRAWNNHPKKSELMLFFVMYDIENDKIRTHIAKYLIRKGCVRVQKSIYLANLPKTDFDEIASTIKGVQEVYENSDSVLIMPASADHLAAMRIIGKDVDVVTHANPSGLNWL